MKIEFLQFWLLWLALALPGAAQTTVLRESEKALLRGEAQRAEALAASWLKTHPSDAGTQVLLARATLAQGKFQAAYEQLRQALTIAPNHIDALYYLGVVAGALTQMEYQQLYALAPNSGRVHQLLAESFQAQDRPTEAEAEYKAALAANPKSIEVLVALGELKRLQSEFATAATYYNQAVALAPDNYDGLYGLGACLAYQQDHPQAVAYFRRAIAVEPAAAEAKFALGNSLFQLRQFAAAEPELKAAITIEPKLRQAYFLLGQIYQRAGRKEEAQAAFTRFEQMAQEELNAQRGQKSLPAGAPAQPTAVRKTPVKRK